MHIIFCNHCKNLRLNKNIEKILEDEKYAKIFKNKKQKTKTNKTKINRKPYQTTFKE